jgi:hypothetical protein
MSGRHVQIGHGDTTAQQDNPDFKMKPNTYTDPWGRPPKKISHKKQEAKTIIVEVPDVSDADPVIETLDCTPKRFPAKLPFKPASDGKLHLLSLSADVLCETFSMLSFFEVLTSVGRTCTAVPHSSYLLPF